MESSAVLQGHETDLKAAERITDGKADTAEENLAGVEDLSDLKSGRIFKFVIVPRILSL